MGCVHHTADQTDEPIDGPKSTVRPFLSLRKPIVYITRLHFNVHAVGTYIYIYIYIYRVAKCVDNKKQL